MELKLDDENIVIQCKLPCSYFQGNKSESKFTVQEAKQKYRRFKIKNKYQDDLLSKRKSIKTTTTTNSIKRSLKKTTNTNLFDDYQINYQSPINNPPKYQSPINNPPKYQPPILKYEKIFKQAPPTPYLGNRFKDQSFQMSNKKISQIHQQFCHQIQQEQKNFSQQPSGLQCFSVYTNDRIQKLDHPIPLTAIHLNSSETIMKNSLTIFDQLKKSDSNQQNLRQRNISDNGSCQIKKIEKEGKKIKNTIELNGKSYSQSCSRNKVCVFLNGKQCPKQKNTNREDRSFVVQKNKRQDSSEEGFVEGLIFHSNGNYYRRILENTAVRKVQSVDDQNPEIQYSHVIPYSKIVININGLDQLNKANKQKLNMAQFTTHNIVIKNQLHQIQDLKLL